MTSDHLGTRIRRSHDRQLLLGHGLYIRSWVRGVRATGSQVCRVPRASSCGRDMPAPISGSIPKETIVGVYMTQAPVPIRAYYRKMFKTLVYQSLVD